MEMVIEADLVLCECCGLAEECTPEYIELVRTKFCGRWVCGLCGEAIQDEMNRTGQSGTGSITAEEAVGRHAGFYTAFRLATTTAALSDRLIAAVRQIMKKSLSSPKNSQKVSAAAGSVLAGEVI